MSDQPATLEEFLGACCANKELVAEYDRLRGTNLSRRGSPLELAIDDASGRFESDARDFYEWATDLWLRFTIPPADCSGSE